MLISTQSWEFIFVSNLVLVILLPLLLKPWPNLQRSKFEILNSIWLRFFILINIPFTLSSIEYYIQPKSDLPFQHTVTLWHLGISMVNLGLLWNLVSGPKRIRNYYLIVILSGLVSLSALLWTPSLAFTDLYWGVMPGTISLDPIISLPPYYLRAWVTLICCLILIRWRNPFVQLGGAWFAFALIGQFAPSPFLSVHALQRHFKEHADLGPIHIHIEDPTVEEFSAAAWAKEFSFHFQHLLDRLPPSIQPTSDQISKFRFDVFVYASDDSKNRWIHARSTQIGHFPRGEMHISHLDLTSDILAHELAHLMHGQLNAKLKSYIDPFYFEGFAVALSDLSFDNALDDAAAFAKAVPVTQKLRWPRFLEFYTAYPSRAAYALSGGHSALALQANLAPWEFETSDIAEFLKRSPSDEKLAFARDIFSRPPLLYDPLKRDCVRLSHDYAESFETYKTFSRKIRHKLEKYCPASPALTWMEPPAKKLFSAKSGDDLDQDEFRFYQSLLRTSGASDSVRIANSILKRWKYSDSSKALRLKRRLEWEVTSDSQTLPSSRP